MKWLPVQSEYGRAHRHGRAGVVGGALTKQSAARVAPCPRSPPRRRRPRLRPTSACRPGSRRAPPCCTSASARPGLPVLPSVAERLGAAAGANGYGPVAGSPAVREAAAGYFERRGLPTSPDRILLAPGSKALLYALLTVLPGDVVLPRPSWVSYAAQAALAGKRVVDVPIAAGRGRRPRPRGAARGAGRRARGRPSSRRILVLTLPDNPTGTLAPAAADGGGLRRGQRARAPDRVRRDLPRPRLRAGGGVQPGGAAARSASSSPTG